MPDPVPSNYNQSSFTGGMNLLGDDSQLAANQYRVGFNLTNRYGELDLIPSSIEDTGAPVGIKQAITTFGNYVILFVAGQAFYRYYNETNWNNIPTFSMSMSAPRYWLIAVPVATTNYVRYSISATVGGTTLPNSAGGVNANQVEGAGQGNLNGLLVQDNINQPQFIYLDEDGLPVSRVTQTFDQWSINFTDDTGVAVMLDNEGNPMDYREYVPIGYDMAWNNGILMMSSQDGTMLLRSVSGRPLDFVVNVINTLPVSSSTPPPYIPTGSTIPSGPYFTQLGGGDATTTSYSVGVGGISCVRPIATGGWFVSASGANFSVTPNQTPNAPTEFGEYTFIRTFLFSSYCLSDRAIFDTLGDTRFIDLTGIRSFNAVEQEQNEGRNSPFSALVQSLFGENSEDNNPTIIQDSNYAACTLFNNYELYSVQTILGPAILKYDTINQCWVGLDIQQLPTRAKQFAPLQINVLALFAITEDDRLFQLYASTTKNDDGAFRMVGVCVNLLYANYNINMKNPKDEIKPINARVIVNKITDNCTVSFTLFVNNRATAEGTQTKTITYNEPVYPFNDTYTMPDVDTQLTNLLFSTPNAPQGWKAFGVFSWNNGTITQCSMELTNMSPINPPTTQGSTE